MGTTASDRQLAMLRIYGDLISEREDWGGSLVLALGAGADLALVPVAIAGGTTLLVDGDAAAVKAAMRRGELDFVVNTLDEALRTLKNQIRQRRPLSVGLIASLPVALQEMIERGVLPELALQGPVAWPHEQEVAAGLEALRSAGMPLRLLAGKDDERWTPSTMIRRRQRFYAWHVQPESLVQLRAAEKILLSELAAEDNVRRRWLERIPKYVRDSVQAGRWVWLTGEEFDRLPDSLPISPEGR